MNIKSAKQPRQNWGKAFKTMAQNEDDKLIEFAQNQWDEEKWEKSTKMRKQKLSIYYRNCLLYS